MKEQVRKKKRKRLTDDHTEREKHIDMDRGVRDMKLEYAGEIYREKGKNQDRERKEKVRQRERERER